MRDYIVRTRERIRRKVQKNLQKRACALTPNPLADHPKSIITTFFDVEGAYAIPGKSCEETVFRILEVEAACGIHSTYNVVAQLALDAPKMVAEIRAGGHEVASHSLRHNVMTTLDTEALHEDVKQTRAAFADLDVEIAGHRSPQSAWNTRLMNCLADMGFAWSAEDGLEDHPYPIVVRKEKALWRFPVRDDDWGYESDGYRPSQMLERWKRIVNENVAKHRYTAIGFHPWVETADDRFAVFEEFMHWLAELSGIEVRTFGDVASLLNKRSLAMPGDA